MRLITKDGYLTVNAMKRLDKLNDEFYAKYGTNALLFNFVEEESLEDDPENIWIELNTKEPFYQELKEEIVKVATDLGFKVLRTTTISNLREKDDCYEYIYLN